MNRLVPRSHLSDLIGFVYSGMPAKEAAEHFIEPLKKLRSRCLKTGQDAIVPIILDGENAWEYLSAVRKRISAPAL